MEVTDDEYLMTIATCVLSLACFNGVTEEGDSDLLTCGCICVVWAGMLEG